MNEKMLKYFIDRLTKLQNDNWNENSVTLILEHAFDLGSFANLRLNDRVIETGESGMHGRLGTVVESQYSDLAVRWDSLEGENGQMTTSVTHGTRRV
jgi:hypothetical protein